MPSPVYDSQYWNDLASNRAAFDTGMAEIGLSRGDIAFDTGFDASGQVDLSNPYNQAMMLQREWQHAQSGIDNEMAASGQLYSRARRNAQTEAAFQFERSRSTLQEGTRRAYRDLSLSERRAGDALASGNYAAEAGQADRWRDLEREWFRNYG